MAWKREKGTARGYINTDTGARISYRQYRALYVASENYRPLDLPRLAKQRSKQAAFNDLVTARQKLEISRNLASIREANLTAAEIQAAEQRALKVSREKIRQSEQFKKDVRALKRLSKIKTAKRTPEQTRELNAVLKRLDEDRANKFEDSYLKRAPRVSRPTGGRAQQFRRAA